MGGILEECPDCGTDQSEFESNNYDDGIYLCEDYTCPECGRDVGGFADPIYV